MPFIVRKLKNNGIELGAEVIANFPKSLEKHEKEQLDFAMARCLIEGLYPQEKLTIYFSSDMGKASVIGIKESINHNEIDDEVIDITPYLLR